MKWSRYIRRSESLHEGLTACSGKPIYDGMSNEGAAVLYWGSVLDQQGWVAGPASALERCSTQGYHHGFLVQTQTGWMENTDPQHGVGGWHNVHIEMVGHGSSTCVEHQCPESDGLAEFCADAPEHGCCLNDCIQETICIKEIAPDEYSSSSGDAFMHISCDLSGAFCAYADSDAAQTVDAVSFVISAACWTSPQTRASCGLAHAAKAWAKGKIREYLACEGDAFVCSENPIVGVDVSTIPVLQIPNGIRVSRASDAVHTACVPQSTVESSAPNQDGREHEGMDGVEHGVSALLHGGAYLSQHVSPPPPSTSMAVQTVPFIPPFLVAWLMQPMVSPLHTYYYQ